MQPVARSALRVVAAVAAALAGATLAVAVLEDAVGVANASPVYLVAVVLVALLAGTAGAVLTAVGAAILYNFWFTDPRYTLQVTDPGVLLSVLVLLFVGIVVGRLAAVQRERAETAAAREREARALFAVSRSLATRATMDEALARILEALAGEVELRRAWVGIGADPVDEAVAADTGDGRPPVNPPRARVLQRMPGDQPARWVLVQRPGPGPGPGARAPLPVDAYRVRIEASGEPLGSIWALRDRSLGEPDRVRTRLLAATADQVGQAITFDRSADAVPRRRGRPPERRPQVRAAPVRVARPAHAAGHDPCRGREPPARTARSTTPDRLANADAIEREVEYLDRLVTNLLDLSRIEAGALHPRREVFDLDDLLARVARADPDPAGRSDGSTVDLAATAGRCGPGVRRRGGRERARQRGEVHARRGPDPWSPRATPVTGRVRLTIEDDGPGVPDGALPRVFERFYRVPGGRPALVAGGDRDRAGGGPRAGRGDGRPGRPRGASDLGGFAVDIELPAYDAAAEAAARPVTAAGATILVVEDDPETRAALVRELAAGGYRRVEAPDGRTALERWAARRPGPGPARPRAARHGRAARGRGDPARGRDPDRDPLGPLRGAGEGRGARPRRRRLRDQAVRRGRAPGADPGRAPAGGRAGRRPRGAGDRRPADPRRRRPRGRRSRTAPVDLTPREFELLRVLLTHRGRVVTKGRLLRAVWGEAYQGED